MYFYSKFFKATLERQISTEKLFKVVLNLDKSFGVRQRASMSASIFLMDKADVDLLKVTSRLWIVLNDFL